MKNKKADNTNTSEDNLDGVIASLRSLIDRIDSNFREAKDLILELARRLDEEGVVKQGQVCRKIKKILEDKIKQGKITEKWIEECLPPEYKRKYTKSELSSLSQQEGAPKEPSNQPLIRVGNTGDEVLTRTDDGGAINPSSEIQERNQNGIEDQQNSRDVTDDNDTPPHTFVFESPELKILESQLEFMIHREKYEVVREAMQKSLNLVYMIFDKKGAFIHADPDVFRGDKSFASDCNCSRTESKSRQII